MCPRRLDVYMVTYSDDYDALDIHGWNYYLIDDIFSLFMHCPWYLEWLRYALITHRYFLCRKYADRSRAGPSDGLLRPTHLWMTAAQCANAAAGLFVGGQMT